MLSHKKNQVILKGVKETMPIKTYYLMHKNVICATMKTKKDYKIEEVEINNVEHLPYLFKNTKLSKKDNMIEWFKSRSIPENRPYYDRIRLNLKNMSTMEIIFKCKGLRLTDCYWIKEDGSSDTWESVNFFDNRTSDVLDRLYIYSDEFDKNIRVDEETLLTPNVTTEGSLPKVWKKINGIWKLYKANSLYNEGDNEVIWSKILDYVGIKHIEYYLGTLGRKVGDEEQTNIYCVCDNYCNKENEYISAYNIIYAYKQRKDKNDVDIFIEYCKEQGIDNVEKFISDQLIMDYILANADRHWNNFGIVRNPDTLQWKEMMPIYDNGNSLWYKSNIREVFNDPNLNFTDRKKNGETTKQCLRYVKDWSLLDNEKIYDIPKFYRKIKLEVNEYSDEKRIDKEICAIESHIKYLKKIKEKSYKEVVREEAISKYGHNNDLKANS